MATSWLFCCPMEREKEKEGVSSLKKKKKFNQTLETRVKGHQLGVIGESENHELNRRK